MELRQLNTFRMVAELGSFTRSAAALDYVQSTITAQIQALEEELGVTLFDRLGKGIQLTDAGQRLLVYAEKMLQLADEARSVIAQREVPTGMIQISAPETLCIYRLPRVLSEFRRRWPQVQVVFRPCRVADLHREVSDGRLDVAFQLAEPTVSGDVISEALLIEPLALVAPADHRLAGLKEVVTTDLAHEPILLTELGCSYRNLFEHALIRAGVYPVSHLQFNSIEAIKQCVINGMGIAILPRIVVAAELESGRLVALQWTEANFQISTQMWWSRERWQSPALTLFLALAREMLYETTDSKT